jgi:hypothetical protein
MNPRVLSAKLIKNNGPNPLIAWSVPVLIALLFLWFWGFLRTPQSETPQSPVTVSDSSSLPFLWSNIDFPSPAGASASRPVYPYSVIPHGIESAQELQTAIHHDPVVSAHYSDFRVRAVRFIRLTRERQFFVSYRLGKQVYWTKRKIALHAGELLLSDGTHLARTRCGNRLSEIPATPTSSSEPTDRLLNTPVVPLRPELIAVPLPGSPIWPGSTAPVLLLAPGPAPQPAPPGSGGFIPLAPPILCCVTSSGPSPTPNSPSHPAPPPTLSPSPSPTPPSEPPPYSPSEPPSPSQPPGSPIPTPEPGPLSLAGAGLILWFIVRKLRRD